MLVALLGDGRIGFDMTSKNTDLNFGKLSQIWLRCLEYTRNYLVQMETCKRMRSTELLSEALSIVNKTSIEAYRS